MPLLPILASVIASFGLTAAYELLTGDKLSDKEKELLELQQKGQRQSFERELGATQALQREDATAKWQQMLTQLGVQNAVEGEAAANKAGELRAQAGIARAQGGALAASNPIIQDFTSRMNEPTTFRNILGLE